MYLPFLPYLPFLICWPSLPVALFENMYTYMPFLNIPLFSHIYHFSLLKHHCQIFWVVEICLQPPKISCYFCVLKSQERSSGNFSLYGNIYYYWTFNRNVPYLHCCAIIYNYLARFILLYLVWSHLTYLDIISSNLANITKISYINHCLTLLSIFTLI